MHFLHPNFSFNIFSNHVEITLSYRNGNVWSSCTANCLDDFRFQEHPFRAVYQYEIVQGDHIDASTLARTISKLLKGSTSPHIMQSSSIQYFFLLMWQHLTHSLRCKLHIKWYYRSLQFPWQFARSICCPEIKVYLKFAIFQINDCYHNFTDASKEIT